MNKTTEALKLEEASLKKTISGCEAMGWTTIEQEKALAAIRQALAEQEKQEPEVCQFPRQSNNEGGWTIEAKFLNALVKDMADDEFAVGMEETEAVLLALERIYAAPVSAEAIRSEALEEAAKVCDDKHDYMCSRAAAAIRSRGEQ